MFQDYFPFYNESPVKATLKVTVNSTLPTVKLSKSTLTLSSVSTAKTDETTVTLNQPLDVTAVNAVLTAAPSGVNKTEANKKFTFTTAENVLTVSQDGTLKNGTYTFAVTLTAADKAGNSAPVKATLKVTVNAKP